MPTYTVGTGKTYATIQSAVNAIPDNLLGTGIHIIEVYPGGSHEGDGYFYDEDINAFTGFSNSNAADYVILKAMISHNGQRDQGIIIRGLSDPVADHAIVDLSSFFVIDGFGVKGRDYFNVAAVTGIRFNAVPYMYTGFVYKCLVYGINVAAQGSARGISLGCWSDMDETPIDSAEIIDCAVFDLNTTGLNNSTGIIIVNSPDFYARPTLVFNCSIQNMSGSPTGAGTGIMVEGQGQIQNIITNCVVGTCIGGTAICYFANAGPPSVNYCVSSDDTADDFGGVGNQINKDPITDIMFVVPNQGLEDLHIQEGSCCKDTGTDLSRYGFSDDWENDHRPCFLAWDIGADELCFGETCCESCCCCITKNYYNGR